MNFHFLLIAFTLTLLSIIRFGNAQKTILDDLAFRPIFRQIRDLFLHFNKNRNSDEAFLMNLKLGKLQRQIPQNQSFFCDLDVPKRRSESVPTSVHKLRPGDIDIIAAMGDSLTAGNGGMALNLLQVALESKGVPFSIGGEKTWREYLTIPNILKVFNPNIYGFSTEDSFSSHNSSKFNVAELGAVSRDTPVMAKVLVNRINGDKNVKPEHWKLVTLLIGPNDFCNDICYQLHPEDIADSHERNLLAVFRTLRDYLPRTMVQVVLPPDVTILKKFKGKPHECTSIHHFECPCFFGFEYQKNLKTYSDIFKKYTEKVWEVANRDEFHDREDFTVVVQPFTKNVEMPKLSNGNTDFSYMSFDCFHFSQRGYALAANALWNNMLEEVGNKTETWNETFTNFKCPTVERPFLATKFNS